MDELIHHAKDHSLKLTLSFGIGLHHAGLHESDRQLVEELFVNQKIQVRSKKLHCFFLWFCLEFLFLQVLVATATLAWGVNFPAHLVVIKGTEYFDGKTRRYVDFPITGIFVYE